MAKAIEDHNWFGDETTGDDARRYSNATQAPDLTAPTVPGTPTYSNVTSTSIDVSWTVSTDGGSGLSYYTLQRAPSSSGPWETIQTPATNSYSNVALTASTTYHYQVSATDVAGNVSNYSATSSQATNAGADVTAPTVPGVPVLTVLSSSAISATWTESTDASGIQNYDVDWAPDDGGSPGTPTTVVDTAPPFVLSGISPSTKRHFRVRARDNANNVSAYSAWSNATTIAAPSGQLAAGHFVPAFRSIVIAGPRPDAETHAYERHRWAYYDAVTPVEYFVPLAFDGGADPIAEYTVLAGPAGLAVSSQGEVTLTPAGSFTNTLVQIRGVDQDQTQVIWEWTMSTSTDKFRFVATTGNNANPGTIGSPWLNTRAWYEDDDTLSNYFDKIIYYRTGTHNWYLDPDHPNPGNGTFDGQRKPVAHLGFPGESVTFNWDTSRIIVQNNCSGFFFDNLTFGKPRKSLSSSYITWQGGCHKANSLGVGGCRNVFSRITIPYFYMSGLLANGHLTGVNEAGLTIEYVQVGATSEWYLQLPGGEPITDANFSGMVNFAPPTTAIALNGTPLVKGSGPGALAAGQWHVMTPAGWTRNTLVVRLPDSSNPNNLAAGALTAEWAGTVGENSSPFWAISPGNLPTPAQAEARRRQFWVFHKITCSNFLTPDPGTGRVYETEANGCPMWLVTYADTIVSQYCVHRNTQAFRGFLGRPKNFGRRITHKFWDAFDPDNPVTATPCEANSDTNNVAFDVKDHSFCWGKAFFEANGFPVVFGNADVGNTFVTGEWHSYRNTLVMTGTASGGPVYAGLNQPLWRKTVTDDLVFTNDQDGWRLLTGQTVPPDAVAGVTFIRLSASVASTHVEVATTGEVKATSDYYGVAGSTVN